ncbi:MAG: DUF2200 domain-containing protein [Clostridia bacterium]|nr:DUF2200 domain-containing protein [Clostridia bacterium]
MDNNKVFGMRFAKVYPLLIAKAERKGRTRDEVDEVTCWLTGYTREDISRMLDSKITYKGFFDGAPAYHPHAGMISGSICGVKLCDITDPTMLRIRQLDKLVDELAKGKAMDKIKR